MGERVDGLQTWDGFRGRWWRRRRLKKPHVMEESRSISSLKAPTHLRFLVLLAFNALMISTTAKTKEKNMTPALQCRRQRSASQFSILVNRNQTDSVSDYGSWTGVNCSNQTDQVIRLGPGCSNLSGTIHPGFYNLLMLALLTLDLSNNWFRRLIQTELANVSQIEVLVLTRNGDLGDRIPDWIGVNKVHLPMQKITSFYKPRHESHMHIRYNGSDCLPPKCLKYSDPHKEGRSEVYRK